MQIQPRLVNVDLRSNRTLERLANSKRNFRMRQVFKCAICGSQTNLAEGTGQSLDVCCPNIEEKWHATLIDKLRRLREKGHPEYYVKELEKEIGEIKKNHPPKISTKVRTSGRPRIMSYGYYDCLFSYPND